VRHDETTKRVLLWKSDANRRRGRRNANLKMVLEDETGLEGNELMIMMQDREN